MKHFLAVSCIAAIPFQGWADTASTRVPVPPAQVQIAGCSIENGELWSCALRPATISIAPNHVSSRAVFLHELGHIFDFNQMTSAARFKFRRIAGIADSEPWRSFAGPQEVFASAYGLCARYDTLPAEYETQYGWRPTGAQHKTACDLIRAVRRG